MASIKQSSVYDVPRDGRLGFRRPQSDLQYNWRNDPSILPCRELVSKTIQVYLKENASEPYTEEIAQLAVYLENQFFMDALSKEDYLNGENFSVRLQTKIRQQWFQGKSALQEFMHTTTSLPTYDSDPTLGKPCNFSTGPNKPFTAYPMTATGSDLVSTDKLNPLHLPNVPRSALSGSRKRTFDVTLRHPEQVIPDHCSPGDGCVGGQPVDSGPTCSGSVLQYDSEASSGSDYLKTQCFAEGIPTGYICPSRCIERQPAFEGELNSMISWSQDSSSVHTPSTVGEISNFDALMVSDVVNVQQPVVEPSQVEQQPSVPKLQFDDYSLGKNDDSGNASVQKESTNEFHNASSRAIPFSCYEGSARHPTSDKIWQGSADTLLCCYIVYSRHPFLRGRSKIPFLEYLHSQKCDGGMCGCEEYKLLLSHFDNCGSATCDICGPAIRTCSISLTHPGIRNLSRSYKQRMHTSNCASNCGSASPETSENFVNPGKCRKLNPLSPRHVSPYGVSVVVEDSVYQQESRFRMAAKPEAPETDMEIVSSNVDNFTIADDDNSDEAPVSHEDLPAEFKQKIEPETSSELGDKAAYSRCMMLSDCAPSLIEQKCIAQNEEVMTGSDPGETKPEISGEGVQPTVEKPEKQKVDGITLIDFFTVEEIREHISSLKQEVGQNVLKEVVGDAANCSVNENYCQICALDKLAFPPTPIYCSSCGMRIKNYGTYYSTKDENRAQTCFCSVCHNKARGGNITFCEGSIPKSNLVMRKNNLVTEESWVQCDRCEGWQHQICALFNDKRDLGGKAEYFCAKCCLEDLETGIRTPLPRSTAFDARNLPRSLLSDHIEQRLFNRLKQERKDRAKVAGKTADEVPDPTDLVVRVVSCVDKKLRVKQQFLDIFPEKNYPAEFLYRSKVILLFQRIEGADVLLFAKYAQEYGSGCSSPNQRCIYISYLDSVKFFRPDTKTASGEALRTFVYHEIMVAYFDYCQKRGFATCCIWACPPVKGEDYILYCHPETQKTPRPDKLRQWYQSMLKKASKENIVVNFTNLYEKFFVPTGECNTKVTAARLPYFDGDYWSSVAETMIKKIEQEDMQMKVKKMTRRSLKAMGHVNPSPDDVKDILLMQELGQSISSAKEDFIIVHLQFVCTHCHEVILSGKRWFCGQCKNYQLCQRCHDLDQNSEQEDTHISSSGQKHALTQEMVNDVPADTEDNDVIMDNCFLENRHAFLSFCQGNHYQFDSLRRAKHSTMMILYHLHNPNGSSIGTFCSLCLKDIGADPRWRCDICPEINVCSMCYQRNSASCHNHTLKRHLPSTSIGENNKMAKMATELLDVVLHASRCQTAGHACSYPNCTLIRRLFSHASACKIRVAGGCRHCKKTWFVLMMHSRRCKDLTCGVPRCMDLKKHAEKLESESKTQQSIILSDSCT